MGLIFYRVCVLTCYRTYVLTASRPFDASTGSAIAGSGTSEASLRGGAAGIGRVGERNRRFVGERRRDRLRHNKPYFSCSLSAMVWLVRLGDLTTDCSGASRRQRSLRSRRLPVGAKGSCQAAKGWTLSMKLRALRLRR